MVNINGKKLTWVCKTCQHSYLQKNKMPPTCHKNLLEIFENPWLGDLTKFESRLIAKELHFVYVPLLPVSRMKALRGKLVLVPIPEENIMKSVQAPQLLPMTPKEAELVLYQLKKKLAYKQTVGRPELVNTRKLYKALAVLKEAGNPHYQWWEPTPIEEYEIRCAEEDRHGCDLIFPEIAQGAMEDAKDEEAVCAEEELPAERVYDEQQDPVRRNQLAPGDGDICMVPNNPEMERRLDQPLVTVAPGEDQTPVGMLYSQDWDVKAFPHLHNPSGSNGLHQVRFYTRC
jgi:hypothetical protein